MPEVSADGPIRAFFEAGWGATTRIAYENVTAAPLWPPRDVNNVLQPWVLLETVGTGSELAGAGGLPGNLLWKDFGLVYVHAFVPIGEGEANANSLARAAGEIFRAKGFYQGAGDRIIRTLAPSVSGGGSASDHGEWFKVSGTASDHGLWFRSSMSVEYAYWYRG